MVDIYENKGQRNWNTWTQQMMEASDYVLLVCSPQLKDHFSSGEREDVVMYKGMFFSDAIVNCIEAPKFIPVYLNDCAPKDGSLKPWVPSQLHASRLYHLQHLREFYRTVSGGDDLTTAQALQDPKFQEFADLVRHLRGEKNKVPPKPPCHPIAAKECCTNDEGKCTYIP